MAPRRIRHTKIVCTIGPASSDEVVMREMVVAGMNVARANFSHGAHEDHAAMISQLRGIARDLGRPVAIMADLQGPKVRVAVLPEPLDLVTGEQITVVTRNIPGPEDVVPGTLPIRLETLSRVVVAGSQIMLADGAMRLRVLSVDIASGDIVCVIEDGGQISSNKGVNLPDVELDIPPLTEKDLRDLEFAIDQGVDYIAMSFVRGPDDIELLRTHIANHASDAKPQIIAKIEKRAAAERLDDILAASDGVMVARGDLGVELGAAEVPLLQKRIIRRAIELGIPVITATQMLETMTYNSEPTRAEASDVANAVLDGTSAVMLSAETAVGKYPVEAIRVLDKIARAVEPAMDKPASYLDDEITTSIPQALGSVACEIGERLDASTIVVLTETGRTARQIARNRPRRPVLAVSGSVRAVRRMALDWGVVPLLVDEGTDADEIWGFSAHAVRLSGLVNVGERVVYTAGTIAGQPGVTNMLKVEDWGTDSGTPATPDGGLPQPLAR